MKNFFALFAICCFAISAEAADVKLLNNTTNLKLYDGDRLITTKALGSNQAKPAKDIKSATGLFVNQANGTTFKLNVKRLKLITAAANNFTYAPLDAVQRPVVSTASANINLGSAPLMGVNVSGCEFMANGALCPKVSDINWYVDQGFKAIRLPFDAKQVKRSDTVAKMVAAANAATARGVYVILDRHDYGATFAPDQVPFWADFLPKFANPNLIMVDTMNEPSSGAKYAADAEGRSYATDVNAAIAAFRAAGLHHKLLIEWKGSSGMGRFDRFDNSREDCDGPVCSFDRAGGLKDPLGLTMISPHRYFDKDGSGTSAYCGDSSENPVSKLANTEVAARARGYKVWIGEIAVGRYDLISSKCKIVADAVIAHIKSTPEVYAGISWWGGGSAWNEKYIFKIEPPKAVRSTIPKTPFLKLITGVN